MDTSELITVRKEQDVSIGEAALTMAIGIIVERVSRLPVDDRQDLYDLVKGLAEAKDPEEVEAIRVAMREILEQSRSGVHGMNLDQPASRTEKLQKWIAYVANKVQEKRKAAGLTQIELADKSGLPQSHISRIESAKLSPSRTTLEKIAKALNWSISELDPSA
jgi:DNA-binding XRE family transcriptional regulator